MLPEEKKTKTKEYLRKMVPKKYRGPLNRLDISLETALGIVESEMDGNEDQMYSTQAVRNEDSEKETTINKTTSETTTAPTATSTSSIETEKLVAHVSDLRREVAEVGRHLARSERFRPEGARCDFCEQSGHAITECREFIQCKKQRGRARDTSEPQRRRGNGREERTCYKCGRIGHISRDCRCPTPRTASLGRNRPQPPFFRRPREASRGRYRSTTGCYSCGQEGHISSQCNKKEQEDRRIERVVAHMWDTRMAGFGAPPPAQTPSSTPSGQPAWRWTPVNHPGPPH